MSEKPKYWECDRCDGVGWFEGGESIKTQCDVCHGHGVVMADTRKAMSRQQLIEFISSKPSTHYREVPYGFEFGAAKITRACSDEKQGWVILQLETPKKHMQLYVTKTGKVRVFDVGTPTASFPQSEWKAQVNND